MDRRMLTSVAVCGVMLVIVAALPAAQQSGSLEEQMKQLEERMNKISADIEARFSGPEWQAKLKQVEEAAAKIDAHMKSPEWQAQMQRIEEMSKEIQSQVEAGFNSPEWREQVRQLSEQAAKAAQGQDGNRAELGKQMDQLHEATRKIQEEVRKYFDSPEWKEQLRQIQETARRLQQKR